jgi:hypothetical protein
VHPCTGGFPIPATSIVFSKLKSTSRGFLAIRINPNNRLTHCPKICLASLISRSPTNCLDSINKSQNLNYKSFGPYCQYCGSGSGLDPNSMSPWIQIRIQKGKKNLINFISGLKSSLVAWTSFKEAVFVSNFCSRKPWI